MSFSLQELYNWSHNKFINPKTYRQIQPQGPTYKKIEKEYTENIDKINEMYNFQIHVGVYFIGPKKEDKYIVKSTSKFSLFSIFDGHGGDLTSKFLEQYLYDIFVNQPQHMNVLDSLSKTYIDIDSKLHEYISKYKPRDSSGSTATTLVLNNNFFWIANTGDSRIIMSKNGKAIQLTQDHKPDSVSEHTRITSHKQKIKKDGSIYRIGPLAVSRTIGDFDVRKTFDSIIPYPDTFKYKLTKDIRFFVLGSDGLYDVMSNQEIINFINEQFKKTRNLSLIAKQLVEYAINTKHSYDDVTVIIVKI